MAWGTDFLKSIYLDRQIFNTVYELNDEIADLEEEVNRIKSRIKMFAAANIKDLVQIELDDDPIFTTEIKVNELLKEYEENLKKLVNLYHYKEYLEQKNEKLKDSKLQHRRNSIRVTFSKMIGFYIGFGKNTIVIKFK